MRGWSRRREKFKLHKSHFNRLNIFGNVLLAYNRNKCSAVKLILRRQNLEEPCPRRINAGSQVPILRFSVSNHGLQAWEPGLYVCTVGTVRSHVATKTDAVGGKSTQSQWLSRWYACWEPLGSLKVKHSFAHSVKPQPTPTNSLNNTAYELTQVHLSQENFQ